MKTEFANPAAQCPHPENKRTSLQSFGQSPQDVKEFFCRQCGSTVKYEDVEAKRGPIPSFE